MLQFEEAKFNLRGYREGCRSNAGHPARILAVLQVVAVALDRPEGDLG